MLLLNNMELVVLFGLPGAGKTFIGRLMQKHFGFYTYEGDESMPAALKQAIQKQEVVSDTLRDAFFEDLIEKVNKLQSEHPKLVVTQVFIKEKYREQFLQAFPHAKFILVESPANVREARLLRQKTWQLDLPYWKKMADIFEAPQITHVTIQNTIEGEEEIKKQLQVLLT
jgi:gluconokinase